MLTNMEQHIAVSTDCAKLGACWKVGGSDAISHPSTKAISNLTVTV